MSEPRRRSAQRPSERARSADPARLAAYTVLRAVDAGAYTNLELPKELRVRGIAGRDAAFATELTYGATRMRGLYDALISFAAGRPVDRIDANVLATLRLGAHQLLGMRVPAHAAVAETVGLARMVNGAGAAGFVNAVLRRLSERDLAGWETLIAPEGGDPVPRLSVRYSHPEWVVRALRAALLGHGTSSAERVDADLEALLRADNEPAKVSLVARPGLATLEELAAAGAEPSGLSPLGATLSGGDPGAIPGVREGRAAVQDEGSQLVALAFATASTGRGQVVDERSAAVEAHAVRRATQGERWLDLCAGPGGKAAVLAGLTLQRGATLVANEVSEHRAQLVRRTLAAATRAGAVVEVRVGDGRGVGADEPGWYDRVLVDAPCTGLGALRRRPEARWRRTPSDLAELGRLQRDLLVSALDATRGGGAVGYATCSPHLAETRFVVADVTRRRTDVVVEDARALFQDASGQPLAGLGEGPFVQLWPHVHGTDAVFFALLRKR